MVANVPGGLIAAVEPDSFGEAIGLRAGDRLISLNGHPLRDIIDVQFYGADQVLALQVVRDGQQFSLQGERDYEQALGLSFVNPTFDVDIRRCANNCEFCFVKQNAPRMRRSLYIKDDDYRYSFLFGNFVTLTNLTDEDWARLEEQRLSPLYVSVHATDLSLRRRFLAHKTAPDVMDQLRRLAALGIEVHTQVVLVPGLNDGEHLARTLTDLEDLRQAPVVSVGIVPIGLTRYHRGRCRPYTQAESRIILDQVETWRAANRGGGRSLFVYPSDEWYLVAGREVPPARDYDGFPQEEKGVGMVRQLLDEWEERKRELPGVDVRAATLVCGTLIAPVLAQIVHEWRELTRGDLRLVPVENRYFGPVTTVSGLLTGEDVVASLKTRPLGEVVCLPRAMFTGRYGAGSSPPGTTLDRMHITDNGRHLELEGAAARVEMAGTMSEDWPPHRRVPVRKGGREGD